MIAIPWQIVPFRDRVRRGGAVWVRVLLATQVPLARSVVAGRQPTSTRYVEALVGNRAFPLRCWRTTRAHCEKYDLTVDQIALDAIQSRFAELTW